MKKKNIAFILFGAAAMNLIALPLLLFSYGPQFERPGLPPNFSNIVFMTTTIETIITCSVLFCVGIILLIKFRNE